MRMKNFLLPRGEWGHAFFLFAIASSAGRISFRQTGTRQEAWLLDITDITEEEITLLITVGESNHFTGKCQSSRLMTDSEFLKKKKKMSVSLCDNLCEKWKHQKKKQCGRKTVEFRRLWDWIFHDPLWKAVIQIILSLTENVWAH